MTDTKNLWGGRFTGKLDETFAAFNNSFGFDRRLFAADIRASIAQANALTGAGVLTADERGKIVIAFGSLIERSGDAKFFDTDAEDVHSFIETISYRSSARREKNFIPDEAETTRSRPRSVSGCATRSER